MRIKKVSLLGFKRFTNLTIDEIPDTARLVVMMGPNGCGKTAVFDAFILWHGVHASCEWDSDKHYHIKQGVREMGWKELVQIEFHGDLPSDEEGRRKIFYVRSAYRNDPDFRTTRLDRAGPIFAARKIRKLIENDTRVSDNYKRFVSDTVARVYSGGFDDYSVKQLREIFIGEIRQSMSKMFGDLLLQGTGDPLKEGSFFFEKGSSKEFHYKNLSGGEKAAFDVIIDLIMKRDFYNNTVFCIDEPEAHMHTKLQGQFLEEIVRLLPQNSQLWVATHSIGMMRKAKKLASLTPDEVVFLDFSGQDFDKPSTLKPQKVNRQFWNRTLNIALDDLAELIAPKQVVLCEGKPGSPTDSASADFDARCYRVIFDKEYLDTDFISVGNNIQVTRDSFGVGKAIQTIVSGTEVIRVVDRDDKSKVEIDDLRRQGVRVLSLRHLEAYLLDDEILVSLCKQLGQQEKTGEVLEGKTEAMKKSVGRGNAADDVKSAAGDIYNTVKRVLGVTQCGNTTSTFLRDTLAPLVIPGTKVYSILKKDIFGE